MEKINVKLIKIAKKYAQALFEVTEKNTVTDSVISDVDLIVMTIKENIELYNFLTNPVVTVIDKKSALKEIFEGKIKEESLNLLFVLADNMRFDAIEEIKKAYIELVNQTKNVLIVRAVSAINIKEHLKDKLKGKLERILSKQVEINYEINPQIIGGLILDVDGKTIDNSILTQLKNMKKQII